MDEQVITRAAATFLTDEQAGRLILHNLPDSFVLLNEKLLVVYFNRAAREGVRRFLRREIYPGMNVLELAKESRKSLLTDIYTNALQGQRHVTETEFRTEDGRVIVYENCIGPAYDGNDEIAGIIISSSDVTEKKKAQQAIVDSERRLQFALEAAAQGAWDWNLVTNEVVYSASYKKLYGFEENELKDHVSEWITRIHPDDQQKMRDIVEQHLQSGRLEYDSQYRIRAKDGGYRWVMAKGRLVEFDRNGHPIRMIGTHTDITENVQREEALKLMNERFDCMIKATHELLWEWDIISGEVFRAREGLRKVFGVNDDANMRTVEAWLHYIHPDDQQPVKEWLGEILEGSHHQTFEKEYRLRRNDGSFAQIYDRCILLTDETGRPLRLIGAAQDISERRRLENELLQNELGYQKLIHLASINSQEKERAEIGKELHDNVNQVLTTTKLFLELATANPALKDELIRKSLLNINNMIQDIRLLSRSLMDSGIDDLGLLESARDLVENINLTQQVQVQLAADEECDRVLDNNQKLTVFRIIQESLNNVLRHARAKQVNVLIQPVDGQLNLVIEDDGAGFLPGSSSKGVGLKNIQNRIYLINGTLQIQSSPGSGCTIKIQFPIINNPL